MKHTRNLHSVDSGRLIKDRHRIKSIVKNCVRNNAQLKVINAVMFFDEGHPGYEAVFDELIEACDGAGVDIIIKEMDEVELLPYDLKKERNTADFKEL
jgi:hypothetical protein